MRLALYGGGHRIKIFLDVLLNVLLAECIAVVFLIIGKTCQPFGSGKKRFGKTVDNHYSFRINAVCFIPLNGGLVHADTLAKFRDRKFQFYSMLFNVFPDLFWGKLPVLKAGRKTIIRRDTLERFMTANQSRNLLSQNDVRKVE